VPVSLLAWQLFRRQIIRRSAAVLAETLLLLCRCPCVQASQFSRLPAGLLTHILQAVPQQERLIYCTGVSTSWAAAAAETTVEVDLAAVPQPRLEAFQPWLHKHATQLQSLRLVPLGYDSPGFETVCFHLPWGGLQQLTRLDVDGLDLGNPPVGSSNSTASSSSSSSTTTTSAFTAPGSSTALAAPRLPSVREVLLHSCKLDSSTLQQLAQLPGVTRLTVDACFNLEPGAVSLVLEGLPDLECLTLGDAVWDPEDIAPALSADKLTALRLSYRCTYYVTQQLTELPGSAARLTQLRQLILEYMVFDPTALASMTLLTMLELGECEPSKADGVDGPSCFLAAVRGMSQLEWLTLSNDDVPLCLSMAQACDCAALTASSKLVHLEVCGAHPRPLPATAILHMFPAGKQLPQLGNFLLASALDDSTGDCITAADLHSIIKACPAIKWLDITCVLAADADVSVLLQLPPTCCSLEVGGNAFGDEAAGVIAQLTQLTSLDWIKSPGLTGAGLETLTALQQLQDFEFWGCDRLTWGSEDDVIVDGLRIKADQKVGLCLWLLSIVA
jgi:hypothetical protein